MCVCRHTYVAGQCRQKLVCCEHHPPWQCKPPLIQNRKCLPSGLQEPPPTTNNKKHCQLQEVTYLRVASGQRAGIQFNEKIWVKIGQKGSAPVTKVTNNFLLVYRHRKFLSSFLHQQPENSFSQQNSKQLYQIISAELKMCFFPQYKNVISLFRHSKLI